MKVEAFGVVVFFFQDYRAEDFPDGSVAAPSVLTNQISSVTEHLATRLQIPSQQLKGSPAVFTASLQDLMKFR